MVAPRTRADEPAQSTPAARPARTASRRVAAPKSAAGPKNGTAQRNEKPGGSTNGAAAAPVVTVAKRPKKGSPPAMGEAVLASILRHDDDAAIATVRKAI